MIPRHLFLLSLTSGRLEGRLDRPSARVAARLSGPARRGVVVGAIALGAVLGLGLASPAVTLAQEGEAGATPEATDQSQRFDELRAKLQQDLVNANEADAIELLELAERLQRPYAAHLSVQAYLSRTVKPSPKLLRMSAENARRAGDVRAAIVRLKSYLRAVRPGTEGAGDAAAELFYLQRDIASGGDAYDSMKEFGSTFRDSVHVRRFDHWFIAKALDRGEYAAAAERLATIFDEKHPLELERLLYWDLAEDLMRALSTHHNAARHAALRDATRVADLLRQDPRRQARYRLILRNLDYWASRAGANDAERVAAYREVMDAAEAMVRLDPTAATAREALEIILAGYQPDHRRWRQSVDEHDNVHPEVRGELVKSLFKLLDDPSRRQLIHWVERGRDLSRRIATASAWRDMQVSHPSAFVGFAPTADLPMVFEAESPRVWKQQARALKDVPGAAPAALRALAAGNGDLRATLRAFGETEMAGLEWSEADRVINTMIWPGVQSVTDKPLTEADRRSAWVFFGENYLSKTPFAFDVEAAGQYVASAWGEAAEAGDPTRVVPHLRSLDWVAWSDDARRRVFATAQQQFRQWADQTRKSAEGGDAAASKLLDKLATVDQAFETSMNGAASAEAPSKLTGLIADAHRAYHARNALRFSQAGLKIYEMSKADGGRTPEVEQAVLWAITGRPDAIDTLELQAKVLEDLLARHAPEDDVWASAALNRVLDWPGLELGRSISSVRGRAKRLNEAMETVLSTMLDRGEYSARVFDVMRRLRYGRGWRDWGLNEDLMARMIEEGTFRKHGDRVAHSMAATSYQWLVNHRFPGLRKKYAPERYFDDMFVEEARATGWLDWDYWRYGRDYERKIANVAAEILAGHETLPFGYGETSDGPVYPRNEYWAWSGRAMGADADPKRKLLESIESTYGESRFDGHAMGVNSLPRQVRSEEQRQAFFRQLDAIYDKALARPSEIPAIYLQGLRDIDASTITAEEWATLSKPLSPRVPAGWNSRWFNEDLGLKVHAASLALDRRAELFDLVPGIWRIARETGSGDYMRSLSRETARLIEAGDMELGNTLAKVGVLTAGSRMPNDIRTRMANLESRASLAVGQTIPVPRSDPRYPVYVSQVNYVAGKIDDAWNGYLAHERTARSMLRQLDPRYVIWLIERNAGADRFAAADQLAQAMLTYIDSVGAGGFDPEVRAGVEIARAMIAVEQRDWDVALARLRTVVSNDGYDNTRAQDEARLRIAEIYLATEQYDTATELLETMLAAQPDNYIRAEVQYRLADAAYQQLDYAGARDRLKQVFLINPDHVPGKLLQGRVDLAQNKLERVTQLKIGIQADRSFLVPGEPLSVSLQDPALAIVGAAADIQVRAWTDAGDEETFGLLPFDDDRTSFTGDLPTQLGDFQKNDSVLQVRGGERVRFQLLGQQADAAEDRGGTPNGVLQVLTHSTLYASSGEIVTEEDQREAQLERQIAADLGIDRSADRDPRSLSLASQRAFDQIKPGNPIRIRVVDLDRSSTPEPDTIAVQVSSSSGDRVSAVELTETEPFSGVFEGQLGTAGGQAIAYASSSNVGAEPNNVIARDPSYPAWVASTDGDRKPATFAVDLNDNVALGDTKVIADVPGRALKKFFLQTSVNGMDFRTVAQWPGQWQRWDGRMDLRVTRYQSDESRWDYPFLSGLMQRGKMGVAGRIAGSDLDAFRFDWSKDVRPLIRKVGGGGAFVAHARGTFFVDEKQQFVRFRVNLDVEAGPEPRVLIVVNGEVKGNDGMFADRLKYGTHTVEVFVRGGDASKMQMTLQQEIDEPPYLIPAPAEMFDLANNPESDTLANLPQPTILAGDDGQVFDIKFPPGMSSRVLRLYIADYESDAPAIRKIRMQDVEGATVLPTPRDYRELRQNQVLEIVPGDEVTVAYQDPLVIKRGPNERRTARLHATYADAVVSAAFVDYLIAGDGEREAIYFPMRRFEGDDRVNVFVQDPDMDLTGKRDIVKVTAVSSSGGQATIEALETAPHSGVFIGALFPSLEPSKPSEILVQPGDDVILTYRDEENLDPGIPWDRTAIVAQALWEPPQLRLFEVTTTPIPESERGGDPQYRPLGRESFEQVEVTHTMQAVRPQFVGEQPDVATMYHFGPAIAEIQFPTRALSTVSELDLFVQTRRGREAAGLGPNDPFDPTVPGTVQLTREPSLVDRRATSGGGYGSLDVIASYYTGDPVEEGVFSFVVPMAMGELPEQSLARLDPTVPPRRRDAGEGPALRVVGDDELYFGFRYTDDPTGQTRWLTRRAKLASDAFFNVMDRRYEQPLRSLQVGESLYLRAVHPGANATQTTQSGQTISAESRNMVTVKLSARSGASREYVLTETFPHSGVFKGIVELVFKETQDQANDFQLPVQYGDVVTAEYRVGDQVIRREVDVNKGATGALVAFTKQFNDPEMAVQTQFTIAEAYFELAKKHREQAEDLSERAQNQEQRDQAERLASLSRREIGIGKKLLEEALRDFPETESRAQAEYLLGNLAFEFAMGTENQDLRRQNFLDAVRRFTDLIASFPESDYAPKSQFKKALTLEKMGRINDAVDEYVKLSHRYPDDPLVAETITRLGNFFYAQGRAMQGEIESTEDPIEREKIVRRQHDMYRTAGEVFSKLAEKFPDHELAAYTTMLAAQCHFRAEAWADAQPLFRKVYEEFDGVDPEMAAESMYWAGRCHAAMGDKKEAWKAFKFCSLDYPQTQYARFARFELTKGAYSAFEGEG